LLYDEVFELGLGKLLINFDVISLFPGIGRNY